MIKQGMNLTKEQRGEAKHEAKMDGSSAAVEFSDDKKSIESDDKKNLQVRGMMTYFFLSLVLVLSYSLPTSLNRIIISLTSWFSMFVG